jgi:hypothetical protein
MEQDKIFTHKVDSEHSLALVDGWKVTESTKKKIRDFMKDYSMIFPLR